MTSTGLRTLILNIATITSRRGCARSYHRRSRCGISTTGVIPGIGQGAIGGADTIIATNTTEAKKGNGSKLLPSCRPFSIIFLTKTTKSGNISSSSSIGTFQGLLQGEGDNDNEPIGTAAVYVGGVRRDNCFLRRTKATEQQKQQNLKVELASATGRRRLEQERRLRATSKKLSKCRTTKEFVQYARKKGARVVVNSNHVKVSKNGTISTFWSIGKKRDLMRSGRKEKIQDFMAMGIAWDCWTISNMLFCSRFFRCEYEEPDRSK